MNLVQEADIAAAPLVAGSLRESVVDFTQLFMINRFGAMMKKRHATQLGIRTVRDLARQSTIKYGIVESGVVRDYFRTSPQPGYQHMWAEMMATNGSFVRSNNEGIRRVMASTDERPWAFVAGSHGLAGVMQICNVTVVTSDIWSSFAVALPVGSAYTERLNRAILQMRETHHLEALRLRWFPSHCNDQQTVTTQPVNSAH